MLAEEQLTKECMEGQKLPSIDEWDKQVAGKHFFSRPSKETFQFRTEVGKISALLNRVSVPPLEKEAKVCLGALKSFKKKVLHKLCYDLNSESDIKHFTALLHKANYEIEEIKTFLPVEKTKEVLANTVVDSFIYQELLALPYDNKSALLQLLIHPEAINPGPPSKIDIEQILPSLNAFDIKKLGGANNINWKLSNPETGLEMVFQLGAPSDNQCLVASLEYSKAHEHLATSFFSTSPSSDTPYSLTVTELCTGGDLRHERQALFNEGSKEAILSHSAVRLGELSLLCQDFLDVNVCIADIKLTNFLLTREGNVVMADTKSYTSINKEGNILNAGLIATGLFKPPESNHNPSAKEINAEAFMSYQLGLALYDSIVLPVISMDTSEVPWPQKVPLDFSSELFNGKEGEMLQALITEMTDPMPSNRPGMSLIQAKLQGIYPRAEIIVPSVIHENISAVDVFSGFKSDYKSLKSERLTSQAFDMLALKIDHAHTIEELVTVKETFEASSEFALFNEHTDQTFMSAINERFDQKADVISQQTSAYKT